MGTFLWLTALVLTSAALLGGAMYRGASRVTWMSWWGGVFTVVALWYWWAHRSMPVG